MLSVTQQRHIQRQRREKSLTAEEAEQERKRFVEFAAAISGVDAERPARQCKREREMDFY